MRASTRLATRILPALVGLILAAPLPTPAQQSGSDRFTHMDVFNLEFVADPRVSPDGTQVVYVRQSADVMKDRFFTNLWIVGSDGTGHRPLTTGDHSDHTPRWSPDGTRLAWISDREGGTPQVFMRWMDTGETAPLTQLTEAPMGLEWSPDGTHLAFAKRVPEAPLVIGEMPAPPPGAEWADPAKYTDDLVFRFDGVGEIPPGRTHLFVIPAEGGTARQVTTGDRDFARGFWGPGTFTWAADGQGLLVSANLRGDDMDMFDTEIYRIALDDGALTQLTDRRGPDNAPAPSPDGRMIAYTGYDDRYQGYQRTLLWVMNADGSGARALSNGLDRSIGNLAWAPDGQAVYAAYVDEGDPKIARFDLDGSHEVVAEEVGSGRSAYAGPGGWTVAGDGTIAFTTNGPHDPGNVAVVRAGGQARVLTAVNEDLLGAKTLGEVEEIWWESSHDGRRVHGWVIKPPGFDPSQRYPLILEIHGGPFAAYGDGFDIEKQMMAAEGFLVLYTNPRGSTSYGEEFGNLIHHAYPGDDFYDLNSGVDAVIDRGWVDEDNLFVTGGSGGGVLTAWMIAKTDRFNAALAFYPVINWYSFTLTADMAPVAARYWFPGMPWDHVDHYESRSLLSVVDEVDTPTLIMTGEEDWRTPMSESEQYYKALKMTGVEAVLVRVPGEAHGIWGRPSHGISKMTTLKGWFDRYKRPGRPVS